MWVGGDGGGAVLCGWVVMGVGLGGWVGGDGVEQSEAGYPKGGIGMQVLNLSNFGLITLGGF